MPPIHVAFRADTRAQVDAFYKAALAAGGRDNGAPGLRPQYHPNYYGAFVLDPDGHKSRRCAMRLPRVVARDRGACVLWPADSRARASVAGQADQVRRLGGTGQLARHARAGDRRQIEGPPRPERHRREQAGRRRHRRHGGSGEGPRPTAIRCCSASTGRSRSGRCCEAAVRRPEGSRAGDHHVEPAECARGQRATAGEDAARSSSPTRRRIRASSPTRRSATAARRTSTWSS